MKYLIALALVAVMTALPAEAQEYTSRGPIGGGGGGIGLLIPLGLLAYGVYYFFVVMPEEERQKLAELNSRIGRCQYEIEAYREKCVRKGWTAKREAKLKQRQEDLDKLLEWRDSLKA